MIKVLMHCSTLSSRGGMVSVVKNYLGYKDWGEYEIKYIPTHEDKSKLLLPFFFLVQFLKICWTIRKGDYKIAHLHTAERGSFWRKAFLLNFYQRHGIKVVLHHHAAEFEEFYAKCNSKQQMKIQRTLAKADLNIVLSKSLIPMIRQKAPEAKVEVLYNAVNTYATNPYSIHSKNVLFLGQLGRRKGVFDLLIAIQRLDNKIPKDVKFYLCGNQGENEVLQKIKELGIEHRIAHVGWIDGERKQEYMGKTMLNCLPSYNEGLPMTILETMAAGIPNISTNIAAIPEVLEDGVNGFMITPGDIDALCDRLCTLINSPKIRQQFSKASYQLISSEYSLSNSISILKDMYSKL